MVSFYSKVLGCQVTLGVIGMSLIAKKIVNQLPVNYPSLTLPGGALTDLAPYLVWAFKENKTYFMGPFVNYTRAARAQRPNKLKDTPNYYPSLRKIGWENEYLS